MICPRPLNVWHMTFFLTNFDTIMFPFLFDPELSLTYNPFTSRSLCIVFGRIPVDCQDYLIFYLIIFYCIWLNSYSWLCDELRCNNITYLQCYIYPLDTVVDCLCLVIQIFLSFVGKRKISSTVCMNWSPNWAFT